jgi:predicted O-linked N-acetylglucosamine transferase (SPINDLY family)
MLNTSDLDFPLYIEWDTFFFRLSLEDKSLIHKLSGDYIERKTRKYLKNEDSDFDKFYFPNMFGSSNSTKRKLKIGYIMTDYAHTALLELMMPVFIYHKSDLFEIVHFSTRKVKSTDKIIKDLRKHSEVYDISDLNDYNAAKFINAMEVDVLINMKGYTG